MMSYPLNASKHSFWAFVKLVPILVFAVGIFLNLRVFCNAVAILCWRVFLTAAIHRLSF